MPIAHRWTALNATLALLAPLAGAAAERALDKDALVAAPLAQAWAAWTTREGIVGFFAPDARVEARPGGPFEVFFDPQAEPGLKGADGMRFLAVQPQRMISFEWNAPPSLPEARQQRSVVIVRFTPVDAQHTRVSLHHVGWGDGGEWDQAYAYFDRAWARVLANMQQRFEQGPVDWRPWLEQLARQRQRATSQP